MPEDRYNQVLDFLQKKYPNRTTEELFDLLEVIIGSSDILESVNYDRELAAQELIKRYGDAEDRGEIEAEKDTDSTSLERHAEFRDVVKDIVKVTVRMINEEAPGVKSGIRKKKHFILINVIRELEKLL